jgi:flavin reductase (DIM6/NTAB) family NADH-FMN oxidoreductase RutF
MISSQIDSATFRHVLGHYPTGVCIVTAMDSERPEGMAIGSFTSVSLDPPLIAFLPDKKSTSWPGIERAKRFCVNVLRDDQRDLCKQFAVSGGNKFAGVSYRNSVNGSPILDGVLAWIDCDLHSVYEAGDHYIVLGLVRELEAGLPGAPLLFFRGTYGAFAELNQ